MESTIKQAPLVQKLLNVQSSPDAFGDRRGRALQNAGTQLNQASNQIAQDEYRQQRLEQHKAKMQADIDDANAKTSIVNYQTAANEAFYNPESGFLSRKGANAVGGYKAANEWFEKTTAAFSEKLTPAAKARFDLDAQKMRNNYLKTIGKYEATEQRNYALESNKAYREANIQNYLKNPNDQTALDNIADANRKETELEGGDNVVFQQKNRSSITEIHTQRASQIALENPSKAIQYLESDEVKQSLDEEVRLKEIKAYQTQQEKYGRSAIVKANAIKEKYLAGFSPAAQDFEWLMEDANKSNSPEVMQQLEEVDIIKGEMQLIKSLPLPQKKQLLMQKYQPMLAKDGATDLEITLSKAAKANYDAGEKKFKANNVDYFLENASPEELEALPQGIERYDMLQQKAIENGGLENRYDIFSTDKINRYQSLIKTNDPKQNLQLAATIAADTGKHYPQALRQLGNVKNNEFMQVFARAGELSYYNPTSIQVASDALAGAQMMRDSDANLLQGTKTNARVAFDEYTGESFLKLPQSHKEKILNTAIALHVKRNNGLTKEGATFNSDDFQKDILKAMSGSDDENKAFAEQNDVKYIIPFGMTASQTENIWNNMQDDYFEETDLPLDFRGNRIKVQDLINDGTLYAVGANKYKIFYNDGLLQNTQGKDFIFSFNKDYVPKPKNQLLDPYMNEGMF